MNELFPSERQFQDLQQNSEMIWLKQFSESLAPFLIAFYIRIADKYFIILSQLMQETRPDEQHFHQQADIFSLDVTLTGNKLAIFLKDLVEWVIYEKEYTEDDVGKEINKKMDLSDVYASFSQSKRIKETDNLNVSQPEVARLSHKKFGEVVECKGISCYKVERGGKVTSYLTMVDKRQNKSIIYQSHLTLSKVRNLSDQQIYVQMSLLEKKDAFEELLKQIDKQRHEKEVLHQKIAALENQNTKTREQLKITKLTLSSKTQTQSQENELRQQKVIASIKRAIEASGQINGLQLFYKISADLRNLDIRLEDILRLSISETQAKGQLYPVSVYIREPTDSASPLQIKRALLSALVYPLQLVHPDANMFFVQAYQNVPIQQSICVELNHQLAINKVKFMLVLNSEDLDEDHEYLKILNQHEKDTKNKQYRVFYLPRQNPKVCFTSPTCFSGKTNKLLNIFQKTRQQLGEIDEYLKPEDNEQEVDN